MAKKNDSGSTVAGGLFAVFIVIAIVPKQVWIGLGIAAAVAVITWVAYKVVIAFDERKAAAEKQARAAAAAEAARVKQQREEHARKVKKERIDALGATNAARVDSAQAAVKRVIEPIFEADFCDTSYGFRPGKSAHDAIDDVAHTLNKGYSAPDHLEALRRHGPTPLHRRSWNLPGTEGPEQVGQLSTASR